MQNDINGSYFVFIPHFKDAMVACVFRETMLGRHVKPANGRKRKRAAWPSLPHLLGQTRKREPGKGGGRRRVGAEGKAKTGKERRGERGVRLDWDPPWSRCRSCPLPSPRPPRSWPSPPRWTFSGCRLAPSSGGLGTSPGAGLYFFRPSKINHPEAAGLQNAQ